MRSLRYRFLLRIVTVFLSISFADATAQRGVTYIVSVPSPGKHVFHVEMEMSGAPGPLKILIPAFQPGDPGPKRYARFIEHVKVAIGKQDLHTKRVDPNTWALVLPQSGTVHVEYDVEADPKDELQLDNHWVDETGGYFDSTSLLLYPDAGAHLPVFLKLNLPPQWKVATSLPKEEGGYSAKDYLTLIDSPVIFGNIIERTISVNGILHRLVFPASLPSYDSAKLDSYIEKIGAYEIKLFGSVPFASHISLFRWRPDLSFGGGMEHSGGLLMNIGKEWMQDLPAEMIGTFAHEYFHAWNAEAIHAHVWHDATALTRTPVYDDLLWFQEGVTSYYADLALVRTGIISIEDFYSSWVSPSITQFESGTGRGFMSLADASTISGSGALEDLDYYCGGEVVGFLLDLRIRLATQGRHSLDDVMRRLYAQSRQHYAGYSEEEIITAINSEAGTDLQPFFYRLVHEKERLDYRSSLENTGLSVSASLQPDGSTSYKLAIRQDATQEQLQRLKELVASSRIQQTALRPR
jgi:predicted metalloprotease with PDZ domain